MLGICFWGNPNSTASTLSTSVAAFSVGEKNDAKINIIFANLHSSLNQTPCCPSLLPMALPFQYLHEPHLPAAAVVRPPPASSKPYISSPVRARPAPSSVALLSFLVSAGKRGEMGVLFLVVGRRSSLCPRMQAGHIRTTRIKPHPAINITSSTLCVLLLGYCTRVTSTNTTAISCTTSGIPGFPDSRLLAGIPRSTHRPLCKSTIKAPSLTPGEAPEPGHRSGCRRASLAAAAGTWGDM